jgi:hypothetical protein
MNIDMPGYKADLGKVRWDLIPMKCMQSLAEVLTFGAHKYADNNWKKIENGMDRYYAALLRHLAEWRLGNKTDAETGLPHLSHAMCCLTFMLWFYFEEENKRIEEAIEMARRVRESN